MASFIAPNYIPEFNPHISTIPIDLYARVIGTKQEQYNQGLQRIQSYVQNVTGLEMDRESDQKYYQEKVGQLRSQIEGTLASDLSQQNVIMQAGSFASQLYNDKRVRNSVLSNIHKKDYVNQLSKAQEDGTYAPENADYGLQAISAWENGDENATLGKLQYTPFDNYMPRLQKLMKDVHPDIKIDQHSPLDSSGRPIPYTLIDGKVEAITDAKALATYNMFFETDASARNQRGLTNRYFSRQISDESALGSLQMYNQEQNKSIDSQLDFYQSQKVFYSKDNERLSQIDKNIQQLNTNKETLNSNYLKDLEDFRSNPEAVKANIWDRQQRQQFVDSFAYKNESQKMVENPEFAGRLAQQKVQNQVDQFNAKMTWDKRVHEDDLANAAANNKDVNSTASLPYGGTPSNPGDQNLGKDFGSPESVQKILDDEIVDVVNGQSGMYGMIYEASKYQAENGVMVAAAANLIQRLPNGTYVKKEGVTDKQIGDVYKNLKKRYESQDLDMTDASDQVVSDWFGSTDESRGAARMEKVLSDRREFSNLIKNVDKTSPDYVRHKAQIEGYQQKLARAVPGSPEANAATMYISGLENVINNELLKDEGVRNFSKNYAEKRRYSGVSFSKEDKEGFSNLKSDALLQIQTQKLGDDYLKAIEKAEGFYVEKDLTSGRYQLQVLSTYGKTQPIQINEQLGRKYTGNYFDVGVTNPSSAILREQTQNEGLSSWRVGKPLKVDSQDFVFRWNSRLNERNGAQYPTFQFAWKGDGDVKNWKDLTILNSSTAGNVIDVNGVQATFNTLLNYDRATILELIRKSNHDISAYQNSK